ncbi:MAG: Hpt domain-containing protein [Succinivibrionaceae bacterium]|nr:Hpt domain-containing protein [Succinivibrionaceae bacterium]
MLIDVNTLRGLVADLGVEAFETLMNLFREDAGLTVQKLEHIFVEPNDETLALEVHTLKSVAATYGAFEVLELARDLDASCKKKIPAKDLLPQVKQLIESLKLTIAEVGALDVSSLA